MRKNVFGNSATNSEHKIVTSLFVQNPYLRTSYLKIIIEEDIDLKNEFTIKNLPNSISLREAASKSYVDNKITDPGILKNTAHVDCNDKNLDNVRFVKVNWIPTREEHPKPNLYVDLAHSNIVDESSLLRVDPDEKMKLGEKIQ